MSNFEDYGLQRLGDDPNKQGYELLRDASGNHYRFPKGISDEDAFQRIQDYNAPGVGTLLGAAWDNTVASLNAMEAGTFDDVIKSAKEQGLQPWDPVPLPGGIKVPLQELENKRAEFMQGEKDRRTRASEDLKWSESWSSVDDLDDASSYLLQLGIGGAPYLATFAAGNVLGGPVGGALLTAPLLYGANAQREIEQQEAQGIAPKDIKFDALGNVITTGVQTALFGAIPFGLGRGAGAISRSWTSGAARGALKIGTSAVALGSVMASNQLAQRAFVDLPLFDEEAQAEYTDAAISGAVLGSAFGGYHVLRGKGRTPKAKKIIDSIKIPERQSLPEGEKLIKETEIPEDVAPEKANTVEVTPKEITDHFIPENTRIKFNTDEGALNWAAKVLKTNPEILTSELRGKLAEAVNSKGPKAKEFVESILFPAYVTAQRTGAMKRGIREGKPEPIVVPKHSNRTETLSKLHDLITKDTKASNKYALKGLSDKTIWQLWNKEFSDPNKRTPPNISETDLLELSKRDPKEGDFYKRPEVRQKMEEETKRIQDTKQQEYKANENFIAQKKIEGDEQKVVSDPHKVKKIKPSSSYRKESIFDKDVYFEKENLLLESKNNIGVIRPLTEIGPVIFRETTVAEANLLIPGRGAEVDLMSDRPFFATSPELALGQGENEGILLAFDTKNLHGQISTQKPTFKFMLDKGKAEVIGRNNPQSAYRKAVRAIRIYYNSARGTKADNNILNKSLNDLELSGWNKTQGENYDEWTRPNDIKPSASTPDFERFTNQKWTPEEKQKAIKEKVILNDPFSGEEVPTKLYLKPISPEVSARFDRIKEGIKRLVDKFSEGRVNLEFFDKLSLEDPKSKFLFDIGGMQSGNLIRLALLEKEGAPKYGASVPFAAYKDAFHELWHWLDDIGAIKKSDLEVLTKSRNNLLEFINDQYGKGMANEDLVLFNDKELQAEAFGHYAFNKTFGTKELRERIGTGKYVFNKIIELVNRIRDLFRKDGFRNFRDVFGDALTERDLNDALFSSRNIANASMFNTMREVNKRTVAEKAKDFGDQALDVIKRHITFGSFAATQVWFRDVSSLLQKGRYREAWGKMGSILYNKSLAIERTEVEIAQNFKEVLEDVRLNEAMDRIAHLQESGQKIETDANGRLVHVREDGKRVVVNSLDTEYILRAAKMFQWVAAKNLVGLKERLQNYGEQFEEAELTRDTPLSKLKEYVTKFEKAEKLAKDAKNKEMENEYEARKEDLKQLITEYENLASYVEGKKPYVPHYRFGTYHFVVYDKTKPATKRPGQYEQAYHDAMDYGTKETPSELQLKEKLAELKEKFRDEKKYEIAHFIPTYDNIAKFLGREALSMEMVSSLLDSMSGNLGAQDLIQNPTFETKRHMYERIDNMLKARYGGASLVQGKPIPGYSREWGKVLPLYLRSFAIRQAGMEAIPQLMKLHAEVRKSQDMPEWEKKDFERDLEYVSSPKQDWAQTRAATFSYTLGANISTIMLQTMNAPTVIWSKMFEWDSNAIRNFGTMVQGGALSAKISSHFWGGKLIEREPLIKLMKDSWLFRNAPKEQIEHVADMVVANQGRFKVSMLGDVLEETTQEIIKNREGHLELSLRRLAKSLGWGIQKAENWSRLSSFLAYTKSLTEPGGAGVERIHRALNSLKKDEYFKPFRESNLDTMSDAEMVALYSTMEVHGLFGKTGRNVAQRGPLGAVVFPFMTYPMQMMELIKTQMFNRGPAGKKAAFAALGSFFVLGGMMGIPGYNLATSFYDWLKLLFTGEKASFAEDAKKWAMETFGLDDEEVYAIERGIFTYAGVDVAKRIGLPIFGEDMLTALMYGGDKVDFSRFAGPLANLWTGAFESFEAADRGRYFTDAAANFTPTAVKNLLQAISYAHHGYETSKGTRLLGPEAFSVGDIVAKGIGIQPKIVSRALLNQRAKVLATQQWAGPKSRFTERMARIRMDIFEANQKGDEESARDAVRRRKELFDEIRTWGKDNGVLLNSDWWNGFNTSVKERFMNFRYPGRAIKPPPSVRRVLPDLKSLYPEFYNQPSGE